MKVFISSLIRNFGPFRDAAASAARTLRHEVKRAEDFGASPESPQRVCLAEARSADVTLLILGESYGQPQGGELSPTHQEYREAREHGQVLVFIQQGISPEPRQQAFIEEVQQWSSGHYTASFSTPEELQEVVTAALHDHELARAQGPVDEAEMLERASALVLQQRHSHSASLCIVVAGSPRQQILRPAALEKTDLREQIMQTAMFGADRVLVSRASTEERIRDHALFIEQESAAIMLTPLGDVHILQPAYSKGDRHDFLPALIEEDVQATIARSLRFSAWLLDHVDPNHRLRSVAPVAALTGAQYVGWMTRGERSSRGGRSVTMRMGNSDEPDIAALTPAARPRAALRVEAAALAEDLTVMLRRKVKG